MITSRVTLPSDGSATAIPLTKSGSYGKQVGLLNVSSEEIQIGNATTCTANDSFPLAPGAYIGLELDDDEVLYARSTLGNTLTRGLAVVVSK